MSNFIIRNGDEWPQTIPIPGPDASFDTVSLKDQQDVRHIIYVRPTGSDTTGDGTSEATAYATLDRGLADIPDQFHDAVYVVDITDMGTISLGVGEYFKLVGKSSDQSPHGSYDYDFPWGTDTDIVIQAIPTEIGTIDNSVVTTQSKTGFKIYTPATITGPAWAADSLRGKYLVSNTACRLIVSNDATSLTVASPTSMGTGLLSIMDHSAEITQPSKTSFYLSELRTSLTFRGIKFTGPVPGGAGSSLWMQLGSSADLIAFQLCAIDGYYLCCSKLISFDACTLRGSGTFCEQTEHQFFGCDFYPESGGVVSTSSLNRSFGTFTYCLIDRISYTTSSSLTILACWIRGRGFRMTQPSGWTINNYLLDSITDSNSAFLIEAAGKVTIAGGEVLSLSGNSMYHVWATSGAYVTLTSPLDLDLGCVRVGSRSGRTLAQYTGEYPQNVEFDALGDGSCVTSVGASLMVPPFVNPPQLATVDLPATATVGNTVWDTTEGVVKTWNGINWAYLGEPATAAAAVDAGALIKSAGVAGEYEMLGAADDPTLMVGVAITGAGAPGPFVAAFVPGTKTTMLSDGTGIIAAGAPLTPSTTVAGRVMTGGIVNVIGVNVGAAVAAVLDDPVTAR